MFFKLSFRLLLFVTLFLVGLKAVPSVRLIGEESRGVVPGAGEIAR